MSTAMPVNLLLEPMTADPGDNPDSVAEMAWRACAAAIAQQPVMRVANQLQRYPARQQRRLTITPPRRPAAVPTWRRDGTTRLLVVDLDSKRGNVVSDSIELATQLEACGARVVIDESPSGGRHLYVLLQEPVTINEMNPVAHGLAARWPTVDIAPMVNVAAGCIRPPGAAHRLGGAQRLVQSLSETVAALSAPAPAHVWELIKKRFAPPPGTAGFDVDLDGDDEQLPPLPGYDGQITGKYRKIAHTGDWSGYPSASEARQAVIWATVAAGMALPAVIRLIETGAWPGMTSFYARYDRRHRHGALVRDWHKGIRFEKKRRADRAAGISCAQKSDTRWERHSGGVEGAAITHLTPSAVTQWIVAMDVLRPRWADEPTTQLLLRALAQAAQQTGSTQISRGVRGFALAIQSNTATAARALARLRDEPDPVIKRIEVGRGVNADTYVLVVPESVAASIERRSVRRRQVRGLHPVARELGKAPGFVYETLRERREPISVLDLVKETPYAESSVREALLILAEWDLARHDSNGWSIGKADAGIVAIRVGADIEHLNVVQLYRRQRQAWHDRLGIVPWLSLVPTPPSTGPPPPPEDIDIAVDPEQEAIRLLEELLGAELVREPKSRRSSAA